MTLNRRACLSILAASLGAACTEAVRPAPADVTPPPPPPPPEPEATPEADHGSASALTELEHELGGRVGLCAIDTDSGATLEHRADERFAMCSTFKWALAAAVLARVDRDELSLQDTVPYEAKDLLDYAPVTRDHLPEGQMSVEALAEAAVTLSDNTAANLLLGRVDGPAGLTAFLRQHHDEVTRLDRNEPTLNTNLPDDPRDTTTPRAMATTLHRIAFGTVLEDDSRQRLLGWLEGCRTCDERLRAGIPESWRAGGKTGTCNRGACNDVAVLWPPGRAPIVVAAYLSDSDASLPELTAAQAAIGRIVAQRFS